MNILGIIMDNTYNPEIFTPQKPLNPHEHRKLVAGILLAAAAMTIIGFVYWWQAREEVVTPLPVDSNKPGQTTLTPEESRIKAEILQNENTAQMKLSPEERKIKEEALKGVQ